jgi:hypothetical protein
LKEKEPIEGPVGAINQQFSSLKHPSKALGVKGKSPFPPAIWREGAEAVGSYALRKPAVFYGLFMMSKMGI